VLSTWQIGKWRDVPISLHWTVLIGLPWLFYQTRSVVDTLVGFIAFFLLLLAHELGHAAVAHWRHVEVHYIRLLFIHGLCAHDEPYHEEDDIWIAWGGVAAQLAVLLVAVSASLLLVTFAPGVRLLAAPLFEVLIEINLVILVVNLIPVAPLDGAKGWRALPLLQEWLRETSWALRLRQRADARAKVREKQLETESERVAADIISRLKKGSAKTSNRSSTDG
jgi:stage IV sporulation protein FB